MMQVDEEILRLKRLTLESEDSSYDSDYETTDGTSHNDVSRTVSDTLAQEFDEYITTAGFGPIGINVPETTFSFCTDFNQTQVDDPHYQSRVDFARKLGYSEEQFKIALSKLGPFPSQDELLAELIQLDCWNSASLPRGGEGTSNPDVGNGAGGATGSGGAKLIILRQIVIDGSNVAMTHGNNKVFSCRGIQLAVDYFRQRGHKDIIVFVPSYRKESSRPDFPVTDQELLLQLEKEGALVFTPSRTIGNKRFVCYDDRYIVKLAVDTDGVVVSNDNYRDLTIESAEFKKVISERMLMYSFVNDRFMPPEDPLGRNGPTLDQFLSKTPLKSAPPCPYGRKCTYGSKCKYFHPIIKQSVSDCLRKQAALKATQSLPLSSNKQTPIVRTRSAVPLGHTTSLSLPPSQPLPNNTHKKLQRQLSINPVCDPRVNLGCGRGSSDTGNFLGASTYLSPFPTQPRLAEVWSPPVIVQAHVTPSPEDEERQRMYFHLAAIFPKYQVTQVMNMFPHEKDPQVICKHIIKHFN